MKYCQESYEGFPVAAIEDPARRELAARQVGQVFRHHQHQEIRVAEHNISEGAKLLIGSSNWDFDLGRGDEIVMDTVYPAVLKIANGECPSHADRMLV